MLTLDPELQAVGSETKIPYEEDYDFYLECLLKCSNWAIETINFFNIGIFGSKKVEDTSTALTVPPAPSHTWEDDCLDDLDSGEPAAQMPTSTSSPQLLQSFFLIVLSYFLFILIVYLLGEVDIITSILRFFSFAPYPHLASLTFLWT